mgnify:CR=1 FL=1
MTIEEALEYWKFKHERAKNYTNDHWEADERHDHEVYVEALRIAVKAIEKQIPKKIKIWNGQCACPNCGKLYGNYSTFKQLTTWEMPYCKYCGQAIDWSDTE